MADRLHKKTDDVIAAIEKRLSGLYAHELTAVNKQLNGFISSIEDEAAPLLEAYKTAETLQKKEKAKKAYRAFFAEVTKSRKFKALAEKLSQRLYITNVAASDYINSRMAQVYTMNYNFIGRGLQRDLKGYNFIPVEVAEVEKYGDLTKQTINKRKDKAWNVKNLALSVAAGAFAMQSAKDIIKGAARISVNKNQNSANLHARDMSTDAESKGRLDGMYRASDCGFDIQKRWNATKDNVTRETHQELDGKTIPLDESFLPDAELQQPRDPNGPPEEICNCRCVLTYFIPGLGEVTESTVAREGIVHGSYKKSSSFSGTQTVEVPNMTFKEWQEWRKK